LCQQVVNLNKLARSPARRAHGVRACVSREPGSYRERWPICLAEEMTNGYAQCRGNTRQLGNIDAPTA
jgi:hypothetical protein